MKQTIPGRTVRPAHSADREACNDLSRQALGFERGKELVQAIQKNTALVSSRSPPYRLPEFRRLLRHSTAETNLDLQALIAVAESFGGPGFLLTYATPPCCAGVWRMVYASCSP